MTSQSETNPFYGATVDLPPDDEAAYEIVKAAVVATRNASIAFVQRKFQVGYNRAARFMERMEDEGVVSRFEPSSGTGRTVLVLAKPL